MSHGPPSESGIAAEPNLTPMLDMVLQILMFFIICADLKNKVSNVDIDLPDCESARIKEDPNSSYLFLSLKPYREEEYEGKVKPDEFKQIKDMGFAPGETCVLTF